MASKYTPRSEIVCERQASWKITMNYSGIYHRYRTPLIRFRAAYKLVQVLHLVETISMCNYLV